MTNQEILNQIHRGVIVSARRCRMSRFTATTLWATLHLPQKRAVLWVFVPIPARILWTSSKEAPPVIGIIKSVYMTTVMYISRRQ